MKAVFLLLFVALPSVLRAAEDNQRGLPLAPIPSEARQLALETASSLSEKGFKVRDTEWAFTVDKATPRFLRLTLFVGNEYRFAVATPVAGAAFKITLYDAQGHSVPTEVLPVSVKAGTALLVGVSPMKGGEYFLGVSATEKSPDLALDCSLLLAYK